EHRLPPDVYVLFIEVGLKDASEFYQQPTLEVKEEEGRYILKITRAASIAHTLTAVALELAKVGKPPEIHFGWTDDSPVAGTRVGLEHVIDLYKEGFSAAQIQQEFDHVPQARIDEVITFYLENRDAVEAYLREGEEIAARLGAEYPKRFTLEELRVRNEARR